MSNPAPPPVTEAWVVGLPKAEVHVHLEGCIPFDLLADAAAARGEPIAGTPDDLFVFGDLPGLLRFLDWSCGLITEEHQLEAIAYRFARRAAACGIRYSDAIINPTHWPSWQPRPGALVAALDRGFTAAEEEGLPPTGLCLSLKRTQTKAASLAVVDRIIAEAHPRVVALSIDGDEAAEGPTADRFAPAFERAAEAGLRRCAHAGESSGPEGVRDAIDRLHAERVDHGIRSIEDAALVEELAERRIPLDVCVTSNVSLGVAASLAAHPVELLRRAGVPVSLNTDDPLLFRTDVPNEYVRAATEFGWDRDTTGAIARTSIDACFAAPAHRAAMLAELDDYLAATEPTGSTP